MTTIAADVLLAEHGLALRRHLGARCRDAELVAELMQEVAARLVAAAPRLETNGNLRGYLFRIADTVWFDHLRRELVRRRGALELAREERTPAAADERLLAAELQIAVRRAIAALPPAQREVLELRHRGELKFREIAERLDRPLGTVLTQMRAALEKIGAALEDYR